MAKSEPPETIAAQSSSLPPVSKGHFAHYMLKEVYEQPEAIRETLRRHLSAHGTRVGLDSSTLSEQDFAKFARITIAASGASRHAGLAGKQMIEELAGIPVDVEHASEYGNRDVLTSPDNLVLLITQSGETADVVSAQREARSKGCKTLALTNVPDSTVAREADAVLYTYAGREVAIPATKSFTTALAALYVLALYLAQCRGRLTPEKLSGCAKELESVASQLESSLPVFDERCKLLARRYFMAHTFFFLGRAGHFAVALEGALKLKEISYIHAEGYPTGELAHGPTALLEPSFPAVVIATCDRHDPDSVGRYQKTYGNLKTIRSRSECVIVVATEGDTEVPKLSDEVVFVPAAPELLSPVLEIVPLQLLAYYIAIWNHYDVDRPRNLVKSVQQE
ncbi:MAG TPA: isomerizing glutamine--fructose-6-phosphate transaminase [Candidatus Koribacter sp.]|jgi:glucosamine--fructose-6-phosphate aminotransferase (isomerizing)